MKKVIYWVWACFQATLPERIGLKNSLIRSLVILGAYNILLLLFLLKNKSTPGPFVHSIESSSEHQSWYVRVFCSFSKYLFSTYCTVRGCAPSVELNFI